MSDFGDSLWVEASRDVEAEASERTHTLATQAATSACWPFLALAKSPEEFEHRLALVDDRLRSIASEHGVSYEDLTAPLRNGFNATLQTEARGDDETLGPCGCTDYHMADCPVRTGGSGMTSDDYYERARRRGDDDEDDDYYHYSSRKGAGLDPKAAADADEDEGVRFQCPDCHGDPMWFDLMGGKGLQTCQGACGGSGVVYRKRKADSDGGYSLKDFDFTPAPKTASQQAVTAAGLKCKSCGHSNPTHVDGGVCECGCKAFTPNRVTASFDERLASIKQALEEGQDPLAWLVDGPVAAPTHHNTVQQFEGTNPVAYDAAMSQGGGHGQPENEVGHQTAPDSVRTSARERDPFA